MIRWSFCANGSSPRTWGTHRGWRQRRIIDRFIPTHVGNAPRRARGGGNDRAVYPHARGERPAHVLKAVFSTGSSPRTWGTLCVSETAQYDRRFIPTHVGNADRTHVPTSLGAVHPHARGERGSDTCSNVPGSGSSPRTWGTHIPLRKITRRRRFIPTHVGNAVNWYVVSYSCAVHPHARGER